jgi:hypothetical protein
MLINKFFADTANKKEGISPSGAYVRGSSFGTGNGFSLQPVLCSAATTDG